MTAHHLKSGRKGARFTWECSCGYRASAVTEQAADAAARDHFRYGAAEQQATIGEVPSAQALAALAAEAKGDVT